MTYIRTAAAVIGFALGLATPLAQAGLGEMLGLNGDSGSGKVAHLEFRLDDAIIAPTTAVVWSPDGRFIATSGIQSMYLHIWNVAQRKLVKNIELPNGRGGLYHAMAWSPDGRYFAICGSHENSLRVFAAKDWSVAKDFGNTDALGCQKPVFSSDSSELTVWADDLVTFSTSDWHVIRRLKGVLVEGNKFSAIPNAWNQGLLLHDMAYVPGTHTLVFGGGQYEKNTDACGPVAYPHTPYAGRVWILKSDETALTVAISFVAYCPPKGGDVTYLALRPDGQQIATGTSTADGKPGIPAADNTKVFSYPSGQLIRAPLSGPESGSMPRGLAYTPDGRYLLVGEGGRYHNDHSVYIVDAQTMQLLDTVHAPPEIYDIAVASDSTMFAVATGTGVTVWRFVHP